MPQFDVFESPNPRTFPLVVDVQADLLSRLESRLVIPLVRVARYGAKPITKLHPIVPVTGVDHVLLTHQAAAIPLRLLRKPVASLASHRERIIRALDLLVTGS